MRESRTTAAMNEEPADPTRAGAARRLQGLAASLAVVVLSSAAYCAMPYNRGQCQARHAVGGLVFTGTGFLTSAALGYMAMLVLYHLAAPARGMSKSLGAFEAVAALFRPTRQRRAAFTPERQLALRATLLKAFFAPLMAMSLMVFFVSAWRNGAAILASDALDQGARALFDRHGFWFALQLIVFVDVLVFTVGYLIELPRLKNEIRSVDPTLLGWAAALLCYAPFNQVTAMILGSQTEEFPKFDDPALHLVLNAVMLGSMAVYASASIALGWKASNLTHRGIVIRGPYAWIRHPAYTCKNIAWWIGSIPLVSAAFSVSLWGGLQSLASVAGWTLLYVLRALTEEDHLRSVDGDYAAYAAQTRYRFIPGVI